MIQANLPKGTKVRVRSDLILGEYYGGHPGSKEGNTFVNTMGDYLGKIVTIYYYDQENGYNIQEHEYRWTCDMFSEIVLDANSSLLLSALHRKDNHTWNQ
ncbi:MAG: hypothetical protein GY861_10290 [bacterium]|nr:hypothetical protein [bacterium]